MLLLLLFAAAVVGVSAGVDCLGDCGVCFVCFDLDRVCFFCLFFVCLLGCCWAHNNDEI